MERVSVYPSDFGLAQMAEEARAGPRTRVGGAPPRGGGAAEAEAGTEPSGERNGRPLPCLRSAPAPARGSMRARCWGSTHADKALRVCRRRAAARLSARSSCMPVSSCQRQARSCAGRGRTYGISIVRAAPASMPPGLHASALHQEKAPASIPPGLHASAPPQGRAPMRRATRRARAALTSGACSCTSAPSCATSTRWPSSAARRPPRTRTPSATAWSLSAARTSWTCASCRTGRASRGASRATWPPRCRPRSCAARVCSTFLLPACFTRLPRSDGTCVRARPVSETAALQRLQVKPTRDSQAELAGCPAPDAGSIRSRRLSQPAAGAGAPGLCAAAGVRDRGAAAHAREADVGRGRRGAQARARAPPDAGRAARGRLPGAPCAPALALALALAMYLQASNALEFYGQLRRTVVFAG